MLPDRTLNDQFEDCKNKISELLKEYSFSIEYDKECDIITLTDKKAKRFTEIEYYYLNQNKI